MNKIKDSGTADSMPMTGSSCGIKPSKEALDKGYEVDFSKAKALLEANPDTDSPSEEDDKG